MSTITVTGINKAPDSTEIRIIVRSIYALQKLRIESGNRLVAYFKERLGFKPSEEESKNDREALKVLKVLTDNYKNITEGVTARRTIPLPKKFIPDEVLRTYTELVMIDQHMALLAQENSQFYRLGELLEAFPLWTDYLKNVKGCGPAMAGVIISEIDIHKARYPSSLHAYAGLDVAPDGSGRSKRKEHLVDVTYIDANKEEQTKKSITFKPFLKSKLLAVLGTSFLRSKSPYADVYNNYKNRLSNHPTHKEKTPMHRHNMAMRYMVKRFLIDLYANWRTLEGLVVEPEYAEAKLGIKHSR